MAPPLPRDQFPVTDRFRYLNHARQAAPPTVVAHALARDASAATMLGSAAGDRRADRTEGVRAAGAALMGVATDDVTLVRNTTDGLALVANGLPWQPGDRVLVAAHEYPQAAGVFTSLAALGVAVDRIEVDPDDWTVSPAAVDATLSAQGGKVRVVLTSWVGYCRGGRNDLAALAQAAHRHGAILVVDLIQGLGVIPAQLGEWGVDAAVAGGQKWLLGPEGTGLLATTAELRHQLRMLVPGRSTLAWDGDIVSFDPAADTSGRSLEGNTLNVGGVAGLGAAIDLLAGTGLDAIWAHVDQWCRDLVAGLADLGATVVSPSDPDLRSAIVSARFDLDADLIVERLVSRGVIVAAWHGLVRFSPHGWNDDDDLGATLAALARTVRR